MNPTVDHVFRQYDIRGVVGRELDADFALRLGKSLGTYYREKGVGCVSLGRDARLHSPEFASAMAEGLNSTGCDVIDAGMVPTPLLYFTLFRWPVQGGVMVTGSHNPKDYNGFKICLGKSTIYGDEIQKVKDIFISEKFVEGRGTLSRREISEEYIDYVSSRLTRGKKSVKVVLDAGNGVGGVVGVPLYEKLGFDVVPLYCDPDGNFPNHHPDPTVSETLETLKKAVKAEGADLGIAYDGDADRIGCVDASGSILWGDQMMVLFSRDILKDRPGSTFVAEVKCSQTLFDDIEAHGGRAIMWKVGHSLIKAKMKEEDAVLAGEMSGHMFFADRYFGYDDAIYSGGRLLELLSRSEDSIETMLSDLPVLHSTPEIRVECCEDQKFEIVREVAEAFRLDYPVVDIDGVRVNFGDGWGLVRASNTQPVLVMRFEAESDVSLRRIRQLVEGEIENARLRLDQG